ncbi:hypothetical protein BUALT_Bualt14G0007500 [Buddleja alternifolia]|uniref:Zinc finger BED domain-containing protein RICESLEEPER 2-like n=1 Tax=Buddleja alternifolia TaxID=168488 RepID=A0AAV6WFL5_9LAMI|nr:hypothetical protein BUALT_Bualt14G0007500 [Buddleja alternifolia]
MTWQVKVSKWQWTGMRRMEFEGENTITSLPSANQATESNKEVEMKPENNKDDNTEVDTEKMIYEAEKAKCYALLDKLKCRIAITIDIGAIERIRERVIYWTASPRVEKFEEAVRQLHIDCGKKLSLDCKTRRNSTYLMLESAMTYKDVFPRVKVQERHYKSLPTDEDWENAIEICGKLKIFYDVTEMFSGTMYPTSNCYFPKICEIKLKLDKWVTSTNVMIQNMAELMLEKYEKCWETCHLMIGVAVVLDPRYKMKLVDFYFPKINFERSHAKVNAIRQNCYDLLVDYQTRATTTLKETSCSVGGGSGILGNSPSSVSGVTSAIESDSLDMFEYDQCVASSSPFPTNVTLTSELDIYLEESVLTRSQDFDVLGWWRLHGVKYPNLQKMARDILAIDGCI